MPFVKFEACLLFWSSIKKKKKFKEKSRNNSQGGTKGYTSIQIRHSTNFKRSFEFVKYSRGRKKLPFTLVLSFTCKWAFVKKFNSKARAKVEASPFETKLTDISPPPPLSRSFLNRISYFKNFPSRWLIPHRNYVIRTWKKDTINFTKVYLKEI